MNREIDFDQMEADAEAIFHNGFACSESVIYALNEGLELHMSDDAIAMSSGFPWGLGGPGCLCGALAGGSMCIGQVFGRRKPGDPKNVKCFALTRELHDFFTEENGAACCGKLIEGYEKDSAERKALCNGFVLRTVRKTAEIILREST